MGKSGKANRCKKVIIGILSILFVVVVSYFVIKTTTDPYRGSIVRKTLYGVRYTEDDWSCIGPLEKLSKEQALEDLDFAYKYFKRVHPITYKGVPDELAAKYEEAKAIILSQDEISVNRLCALVESFISPIEDGHSFAMTIVSNGHYMNYLIPDDYDSFAKINGVDVADIFEANRGKFSFETYRAGLEACVNRLTSLEGLDYLEIDITSPVVYTFEMKDKSFCEIEVKKEEFLPEDEVVRLMYPEAEEETKEETREENLPFVYYDIYEDCSLAVLTLNSCIVNDLYLDTLKEMFLEVKEKNIQNVCVDLRYNGGGTSLVTEKFLNYCDVDEYKGWSSEVRKNWYMIKNEQRINKNKKVKDKSLVFSGDIYLLTSHDTYSAAKDFAMVIKDNNIGAIVGEASGNNPNSYGDAMRFLLPNSRILLSYSYKKWYRTDHKEGFIEPDIPCDSEDALLVLKERLG